MGLGLGLVFGFFWVFGFGFGFGFEIQTQTQNPKKPRRNRLCIIVQCDMCYYDMLLFLNNSNIYTTKRDVDFSFFE